MTKNEDTDVSDPGELRLSAGSQSFRQRRASALTHASGETNDILDESTADQATRPGAVAVDGISNENRINDNPDHVDQDVAIQATLVDEEDLEAKVAEQLLENATMAEVVKQGKGAISKCLVSLLADFTITRVITHLGV